MVRRGIGIFLCMLTATTGWAADAVVIKGSNTFGEELGPRLVDDFQHATPAVTVKLDAQGTATGFAALLDGACDIAAASRLINEDELRRARSRGLQLKNYLIGYYGVVVVVNAANPLQSLTDVQVRAVFTGATANWQAAGWEDAPVQTYIRDAASGTHLRFQELALDRQPYAATAKQSRNDTEIARAVAAERHAIGYLGGYATDHPGLRVLAINNIKPTPLSVEDGRYPYARGLWLYTDAARESAAVRGFIRFVLSRRGQTLVEELGNVPRPDRRLWSPTDPW